MPHREPLVCMLAAALAACWTPQHEGDDWVDRAFELCREEVPPPSEFARSLLRPVPGRPTATPEPGDSVVYALDVTTPSRSYTTYLRFTVLENEGGLTRTQTATLTRTWSDGMRQVEQYRSITFPVRVEAIDVEGERVSESVAEDVPVEFLARGFVTSAAANHAYDGVTPITREAREAMDHDGPAIFSIGSLLQGDETLRGIALDLVDRTLVLSAIWNFGITLSIDLEYETVEKIDVAGGAEGYRFPVELTVNGHPALRVIATVVEPVVPHGLTAGILRVDGFRPTDDRFRVRVLRVD